MRTIPKLEKIMRRFSLVLVWVLLTLPAGAVFSQSPSVRKELTEQQKKQVAELLLKIETSLEERAAKPDLANLLKKSEQLHSDLGDTFVSLVGRANGTKEFGDVSTLWRMVELAIERQHHLLTIQKSIVRADDSDTTTIELSYSAMANAVRIAAATEKDVSIITKIIQQSNDPGIQAIAPRVRDIVRETQEQWSFGR